MKNAFSSTIRMMTAAMVIVPTLTAGLVAADGLTSAAFAQRIGSNYSRETDRDNSGDETRRSPNYPCGTAVTHVQNCYEKVETEPCECRTITRNGLTFRDCYVTLTSGLVKYCNRPAKTLN